MKEIEILIDPVWKGLWKFVRFPRFMVFTKRLREGLLSVASVGILKAGKKG